MYVYMGTCDWLRYMYMLTSLAVRVAYISKQSVTIQTITLVWQYKLLLRLASYILHTSKKFLFFNI